MAIAKLVGLDDGLTRLLMDDGRELTLTPFDFNAWAAVEERFGSVVAMVQDARQVTVARFILWQCLLPAHPDTTELDAGRLLAEAGDHIVELLALAVGNGPEALQVPTVGPEPPVLRVSE